ncbi:hypothetical protein [Empedobacter sp. UBA5637]|uniref:hypothetical protein n=1 Tax=Empedobacter sp. UBA5637 TaxID=1946442 RepID=UPI0025BD42DA|nr:hypothetical protein [Empedobacter sp. UBA5637]
MGVVRGKRSVKIKEKIKAVQIQSTANLFQGPVPANITLKAVPQGFTALNYKWYINVGTSIVGTNQTFIIANNQVETTNVYKVVVTSIDGESFESTISIAKVKDGSAIVAIKRYKDEIEAQNKQLVASYNSLYNNPKIGNYKTTLTSNYNNYNTAYLALINVIDTIVTNNNLTPTDEATLDSSIAEYKLKLTAFVESLEMALKLTTDYLDDTIDRINKVTSFLGTTVDNNVVATGVVLVGEGATGTGGLSGIRDNGDNSIFLFAGSNFANRYKARWTMSHGGFERGYHSNGIIAFERGYDGTKWIFNMYNESGAPLFQLDSVRGLVPVNYTSESWSRVTLLKTNITIRDYNTVKNDLKTFIESNVTVNSVRHNPDEYYSTIYWVYQYFYNNIYVCWDYYNGTHPNNAQYANYVGYKITNDTRVNNITDGWYFRAMEGAFNVRDAPTGGQKFEQYATVYFIQSGKIVETQSLNYIK